MNTQQPAPDPATDRRARKARTVKEQRDRDAAVLQLRLAGATYDEIARSLGFRDRSGPKRAFDRIMDETIREASEQARELELSRLDRLQRSIWPKAVEGHLGAVDRALAISDRRSRLLGLDRPSGDPTGLRLLAGLVESLHAAHAGDEGDTAWGGDGESAWGDA